MIVLPVWVSVRLLPKALGMLSLFVKPVMHELPAGVRYAMPLSFLVLVLGCFVVGLMLRT